MADSSLPNACAVTLNLCGLCAKQTFEDAYNLGHSKKINDKNYQKIDQ